MTGKSAAAMLVGITLASGLCDRVHASDQQMIADVGCVVVGLRMTQLSATEQQSAGLMLAAYYLGRLDSLAPDAEVERLIERERERMTAEQFRQNAVRCGKALTAKGQELQKFSADLSRKGQKEVSTK